MNLIILVISSRPFTIGPFRKWFGAGKKFFCKEQWRWKPQGERNSVGLHIIFFLDSSYQASPQTALLSSISLFHFLSTSFLSYGLSFFILFFIILPHSFRPFILFYYSILIYLQSCPFLTVFNSFIFNFISFPASFNYISIIVTLNRTPIILTFQLHFVFLSVFIYISVIFICFIFLNLSVYLEVLFLC